MDPVLQDERFTSLGLFLEANDAVRRAIERAAEEWGGMHPNFEILMRLARSDGRLRMADLAAQCGLTASGLSRAVDRLTKEGLVVRAACPEDARGAYAELTPKGTKYITRALKHHIEDVQENFIAVLTKEQRSQLESICRTLRDKLDPCVAAGT